MFNLTAITLVKIKPQFISSKLSQYLYLHILAYEQPSILKANMTLQFFKKSFSNLYMFTEILALPCPLPLTILHGDAYVSKNELIINCLLPLPPNLWAWLFEEILLVQVKTKPICLSIINAPKSKIMLEVIIP